MCYMKTPKPTIGVRELRQNLSVYLRRVKAGEIIEVTERGQRVAVLAAGGEGLTTLDRLVAAGRAAPARGDLLALGPPLGQRPSRRVSRALEQLRRERPWC
jgi:antitoxin (DNA-binding transcriptional repressor) of toxin-antitoxin stability system